MLFLRSVIFSILIGAPAGGLACDLALVLAVDVSGSVDAKEYRIQMDGLAEGLRDGVVTRRAWTAPTVSILRQCHVIHT